MCRKCKIVAGIAPCLLVGIAFGAALQTVDVQIAPHTLLLGKVQSGEVTVHVDIPYSSVVTSSVMLEGLAATSTFPDDCGDLVAKFVEADVKALVATPQATLTLTGTTNDGAQFSGSDTVLVKTAKR